MATTFKNYMSQATQSGVSVFTVPAGKDIIVLNINLANITATAETVSLTVTSSGTTRYLCKDIALPGESTLSVLDGKLVMTDGMELRVEASTDASVDVLVSAMER